MQFFKLLFIIKVLLVTILTLYFLFSWPLALETLQTQNDAIVVIDMQDDRLIEVLKQAVSKGQEVLVLNFSLEYPEILREVFERRMTERIHAFVGLMGIPILRKDFRVRNKFYC